MSGMGTSDNQSVPKRLEVADDASPLMALPVVPATEEGLRTLGKTLQTYFDSHSPQQLKATCLALLQTSSLPDLAPSHRIAAFNALCGFVDRCLVSTDKAVKDIVCDPSLCFSFLQLYLQRYEYSRAKSMKQLLGCVAKAVARQPDDSGEHTKAKSLQTLLTIVCDNSDEAQVKPAFHVLSILVHKKLVSATELLNIPRASQSSPGNAAQSTWQLAESLLEKVLLWVSQSDVAPIAGSFIPIFIHSLIEKASGEHASRDLYPLVWMKPLTQSLRSHPEELLTFRLYILPGIFKLNRRDYWQFLLHIGIYVQLGLHGEQNPPFTKQRPIVSNDSDILFTTLQIGKELGYVDLSDASECSTISYNDRAILVCDKLIGDLLGDLNLSMRLSGMSLLISSKQQSRPLTKGTLNSLERYLPQCLVEPDANFRGEILSLIRSLVERIKAVCSLLSRSIIQHSKHEDHQNALAAETDLKCHKHFLLWLARLVKAELHPTASYQRHVTSLKITSILLSSGLDDSVPEASLSKQAKSDLRWGFSISIMDSTLRRLLLDALMDPFEDVRQSAAAILTLTSKSLRSSPGPGRSPMIQTSKDNSSIFTLARSRAQRIMLQSGRIDHADGFARLSGVCFEFVLSTATNPPEAMLSVGLAHSVNIESITTLLHDSVGQLLAGIELAKRSLSAAVDQYPLHGLLTSMRYILENATSTPTITSLTLQAYPNLCKDLVTVVHDVWACVKATLCHDAPEGFLPDETDEEVSMTTRDLLSYSWRALKESSLLLRSMVINLRSFCAPTDHQFTLESLGWLCFTQLAELRHRGAFSTVAQSFAVVCLECELSPMSSKGSLNSAWYASTLKLIQAKGSKITRRSAGIPAAMVGLLGAGIDFEQALLDLEEIAMKDPGTFGSGQVDLPQVHAINCLRAAFISTRIALKSEPYLVKAIAIATEALKSELWPIRNCGLMLFRSLIDRSLGSHETYDEICNIKNSSRLAYDRYPGLLELLVQLLTPQTNDKLRGREPPPESFFPALDLLRRAPPPADTRAALLPLVLDAAGSSQWHIREAAARAFAAIASDDDVQNLNIEDIIENGTDNMVHGRLLCLKFAVMTTLQQIESQGNGQFFKDLSKAYHIDNDTESVIFQKLTHGLTKITASWSRRASWNPVVLKTFLDSINLLGRFGLRQRFLYRRLESTTDPPPRTGSASASLNVAISDKTDVDCWEELRQATIVTIAASSTTQSVSSGKASMRASMALSRILNILWDYGAGFSSTDPGRLIHDIQTELGEQTAEGLDYIITTILNTLRSGAGPLCTILQPIAVSLAGFLSRSPPMMSNEASLPLTPEPVDTSKLRDIARSSLSDVLVQYDLGTGQLTDVVSQTLANLQLNKECWQSPSPFSVQSLLELWGASLYAKCLAQKSWILPLLNEGALWITFVSSALSDEEEFPLRYAAVLSLKGFGKAFGSFVKVPDVVAIPTIFAIYTALNDDDEDIRNTAAEVAADIMSTFGLGRSRVSSAAVASSQLRELLATNYSTLPDVIQKSMERMIGQNFKSSSPVKGGFIVGADVRLGESLKEDTELFTIEKQNLYIDPVREAEIWSALLRRVALSTIPTSTVKDLTQWLVPGLQDLVSFAQANEDGPLGWTSSPDVFALGVQLFTSAKVLLDWQGRGRDVEAAETIRSLLMDLLEAANKASLHEIWVQVINDALRQVPDSENP